MPKTLSTLASLVDETIQDIQALDLALVNEVDFMTPDHAAECALALREAILAVEQLRETIQQHEARR